MLGRHLVKIYATRMKCSLLAVTVIGKTWKKTTDLLLYIHVSKSSLYLKDFLFFFLKHTKLAAATLFRVFI